MPTAMVGPLEGVEVHVGLAYYPEASDVARWDQAQWDTELAQWAGPAPVEDVSCNVLELHTGAGRDQPLERFRTGTASIILHDPDGRWSPWNTAFAPDEYSTVRPGIGLEVWIEADATVYPLFTGTVDSITDRWQTPPTGHRVQMVASDYLSELAAYDGIERASQGGGETSGARLERIAANTASQRPHAFDAGTVALQPTTLAKNALDEAGMVCDTELGVLFAGPDGTLIHRDRNGLVSDPHYTTVQAIFGEVEPELCYVGLELASDTAKIKNVVSIANEGGSAVTVQDPTSIGLYRARTYRRFDLIHSDPAQSSVIATRHLDFYAYADNRVERLILDPVIHPALIPAVLELGLLYRIQLRRRATGFQVVADLQIQTIEHRITGTEWTIELGTFSADAVFQAGRWNLDKWDAAQWAY